MSSRDKERVSTSTPTPSQSSHSSRENTEPLHPAAEAQTTSNTSSNHGHSATARGHLRRARNVVIQVFFNNMSFRRLMFIVVLVSLITVISVLAAFFFPNATIASASIACWGIFIGVLFVAWPVCTMAISIIEYILRLFSLYLIIFYFEGARKEEII